MKNASKMSKKLLTKRVNCVFRKTVENINAHAHPIQLKSQIYNFPLDLLAKTDSYI